MIGFWHDITQSASPLPHPQPLVDTAWEPERRSQIVRYLRSGIVYATSCGYSYCRLCCRIEQGVPAPRSEVQVRRDASGESILPFIPSFNGLEYLCDGVWGWPEGLAHYVEEHGLRLPDEFVAHAAANGFQHTPLRKASSIYQSFAFWREWSQRHAPFTFEPNCLACATGKDLCS
jgi:hypothetical protein